MQTRLSDAGFSLSRLGPEDEAYATALAKADYLVAGLPPVNADTLSGAPRLKGILKHGVGVDSIDIHAASHARIPVCSTPGANAQAVAEMALGAIFAMCRNTVLGHQTVTSGKWQRRRGREVTDTTLGILGLGRIGQCLTRLASGVGMTVIAHDPYPDHAAAESIGVRLTGFDEVVANADALSLHLAATPDTQGLISAAQLGAMKPGALLLNFARRSLVDLDAVAAALTTGALGGAAIDADTQEPPDIAHPVFSAPNVLFSPLSGADTVESIARMNEMVFTDILSLEQGNLPVRTLNAADISDFG
ncbi:NAD(P)-dependent oxidoreductase [Primorskyibacter aestuariivivens]|uniref:NAD(P)-dependent oxidoreductase n=1 Tax=Primorskyibacter aestuariivivens TaxID=1888912 RepID=UPI002300CF8B|nr:NAD(P)-dependent oxidoreductase [Primorskyibacter aestuariivivens]MDA7430970.1 NAD(P)-dependent oxidoreductase [Primorskyibacter aestuariivivens]